MEQDKSLSIWVGLIVAISHLYCQTSETDWEKDDHLISESALAPIEDDFYDGFNG